FELGATLGVYKRGDGIGKPTLRITLRRQPARLDEDRPGRAEPAQRVVEPRRRADELGRCCRVEIGSAELCRALEASVLVEDHTRCDEGGPWQKIGQHLWLFAVLGQVQHRVCLTSRDGPDSADADAPRRRTARRALPPTPPPCARSPTARDRRSTGADPSRPQLRAYRS